MTGNVRPAKGSGRQTRGSGGLHAAGRPLIGPAPFGFQNRTTSAPQRRNTPA
jgi:hypothetical protein